MILPDSESLDHALFLLFIILEEVPNDSANLFLIKITVIKPSFGHYHSLGQNTFPTDPMYHFS